MTKYTNISLYIFHGTTYHKYISDNDKNDINNSLIDLHVRRVGVVVVANEVSFRYDGTIGESEYLLIYQCLDEVFS